MTKIDEAWQALQTLPARDQERAAEFILDFVAQSGDIQISDEQLAELERRMSDPNPEFLTMDEVRARLRKLGA